MFNNSQRKSTDPHGAETSLIARGTSIVGDVHFAGALHVDGRIEGAVLADEDSRAVFTLSTDGEVVGEVHVPNAVINGTVKGNIHALAHLELAADARMEGDVHYRVLEMAAGAAVNGRMLFEGEQAPRQLTGPAPVADAESVAAADELDAGADEASRKPRVMRR